MANNSCITSTINPASISLVAGKMRGSPTQNSTIHLIFYPEESVVLTIFFFMKNNSARLSGKNPEDVCMCVRVHGKNSGVIFLALKILRLLRFLHPAWWKHKKMPSPAPGQILKIMIIPALLKQSTTHKRINLQRMLGRTRTLNHIIIRLSSLLGSKASLYI